MGKYIHGFGILLEFFLCRSVFFRSANLVMGGGAWIPWEFPFCLLNFFFFSFGGFCVCSGRHCGVCSPCFRKLIFFSGNTYEAWFWFCFLCPS
jgi:hypothetical protein